jgi:hypothetical protein
MGANIEQATEAETEFQLREKCTAQLTHEGIVISPELLHRVLRTLTVHNDGVIGKEANELFGILDTAKPPRVNIKQVMPINDNFALIILHLKGGEVLFSPQSGEVDLDAFARKILEFSVISVRGNSEGERIRVPAKSILYLETIPKPNIAELEAKYPVKFVGHKSTKPNPCDNCTANSIKVDNVDGQGFSIHCHDCADWLSIKGGNRDDAVAKWNQGERGGVEYV